MALVRRETGAATPQALELVLAHLRAIPVGAIVEREHAARREVRGRRIGCQARTGQAPERKRGRTLARPAPSPRSRPAASVHAVEAETPAVALLLPVACQREALLSDVEAEAYLWVRRRRVVALGEDGEDPQAVPHADLEF